MEKIIKATVRTVVGGGEGTQGGKGAGACSGKQSSQIKYKNKKMYRRRSANITTKDPQML